MSATELTPTVAASVSPEALQPRAQVIAGAWLELGDAVAEFSNGSGRPLARTLKLILEPLVIRPVQNPDLAGGALSAEAASALQDRIRAAGPDLAAAAAWFRRLKSARRRLRITDGNPQEKYFQRCVELATTLGAPGGGADDVATEVVAEIAQATGDSLLSRVRALLSDEDQAARLDQLLHEAWSHRDPIPFPPDTAAVPEMIAEALERCPSGEAAAPFEALRAAVAGSASARTLDESGTARALGLTAHATPPAPRVGSTASKRALPRPFDRSIFERLFAALSGGASAESDVDADEVLVDEIGRSAAPWQLADERSRIAMLLGTETSRALESTGPDTATDTGTATTGTAAHRLLGSRWRREAYVRRALRMPAELGGVPGTVLADIHDIRPAYLRRLWARLHGRELRDQPWEADGLWDLLDGALRSVIMDQRHRLKIAMGRGAFAPDLTEAA